MAGGSWWSARAPGLRTKVLLRRLRAHRDVTYAEPDYFQFSSAVKTPNDPYYTRDWAVVDGSEDHDIDAPTAWGTRTSCAKVAILDTGVDTDHPDLKDNVFKSEDKPNNGKDDDKNGYVDDTYGYNAIKGKGSGEDDNGHGSHVAGIVGGARQQHPGGRRRLLVDQGRADQVHELQGQGLHVRRHRGPRVRGQEGVQDHQLLVRLELLSRRP